jgi:tetratricopeptide (TPR) repeat protein
MTSDVPPSVLNRVGVGGPASNGRDLMDQGRHREAVEAFRRELERYPEVPANYNNLGVALTRLGQHDEAIANFQDALKRDPAAIDARRNIALAWSQRGRLAEGKAAFREVLRRDGGSSRAHRELANAGGGRYAAIHSLRAPPETARRHDHRRVAEVAGAALDALFRYRPPGAHRRGAT